MMIEPWVFQLLIALTSLITAVTVLVKAFRIQRSVHDIHVLINSRLDQLIEASTKSGIGEGRRQMHDELKQIESKLTAIT